MKKLLTDFLIIFVISFIVIVSGLLIIGEEPIIKENQNVGELVEVNNKYTFSYQLYCPSRRIAKKHDVNYIFNFEVHYTLTGPDIDTEIEKTTNILSPVTYSFAGYGEDFNEIFTFNIDDDFIRKHDHLPKSDHITLDNIIIKDIVYSAKNLKNPNDLESFRTSILNAYYIPVISLISLSALAFISFFVIDLTKIIKTKKQNLKQNKKPVK